jgi:hypothetical protein
MMNMCKKIAVSKILKLLSFFLFVSPLLASAQENKAIATSPLSSEEQKIVEEIVFYLSSHSLHPFIKEGPFDYGLLLFLKDAKNNTTRKYLFLHILDSESFILEEYWSRISLHY